MSNVRIALRLVDALVGGVIFGYFIGEITTDMAKKKGR